MKSGSIFVFWLLTINLWLGHSHTLAEPTPSPLQFVERVVSGKPDDKLPLLIALHGLGDNPEEFLELFSGLNVPVRIVAVRAPDPWEQGSSWFPIDDPARVAAGIVKRAELVAQLADQLRRTRNTRGLPIVTGFSQGGILSFACAAFHAEHFAAALPLAGSLQYPPMPAYRKAPKGFRVIAFHGEDDVRVTYAGALATVALLKKGGTNTTLTGFPGVGHGIPPPMVERWYGALRELLAKAR